MKRMKRKILRLSYTLSLLQYYATDRFGEKERLAEYAHLEDWRLDMAAFACSGIDKESLDWLDTLSLSEILTLELDLVERLAKYGEVMG